MSNQSRVTKIQTPGGEPAAPDAGKPTGDLGDAGTSATSQDNAEASALKDQLAVALAKIEALQKAAARKTEVAPKITGTSATSHAHLSAHQVDPSKIDSPVLTRDGWVVPLPKPGETARG